MHFSSSLTPLIQKGLKTNLHVDHKQASGEVYGGRALRLLGFSHQISFLLVFIHSFSFPYNLALPHPRLAIFNGILITLQNLENNIFRRLRVL